MFFIVLFLGMILPGCVFWILCQRTELNYEAIALFMMVSGGIGLLVTLLAIPICKDITLEEIIQYEDIKQIINIAEMEGISDPEKMKLIKNTPIVRDTERKIIRKKLRAGHPWFKLHYPEEVLNVEPIY